MSNNIHPTAIVGDDVTLGDGNTIGAYAVITGPATIGDGNWIGAGVIIGSPPEVRSYEHPANESDKAGNGVIIGNRNVIREYAQIHQGLDKQTTIGDDTFIMNQVYIARDCAIGDGVTMASSVLLAGRVTVDASANLGLGAVVHQGIRIGTGTMVGMGSVVTRDVPPLAKVYGNPARVRGVNRLGMERGGFSSDAIATVVDAYAGDEKRNLANLATNPELAPHFEGWA